MNPVLYWNSVLLEASRRDFTRGYSNAQQPGPIRTSRAMAIVHLAIHDAIALKTNSAAAYLNKKEVAHGVMGPFSGSDEDRIAGAAVTALKALYPRFHNFIDDAVESVDQAAFDKGAQIAEALLLHRSDDGFDANLNGPQPDTPGYGQHGADPYAPNQGQLGPLWGEVRRFTGEIHQPLAPFPGHAVPNDYLSDPDYLADFVEVREKGSVDRRSRTAEEQRIGVYWGYDGANNIGVPPRLYNQVARKIVSSHNLDCNRTAELFAAINVAMADAGIDAWHWKYHYDLWRPVLGIRHQNGEEGDPFWAPLGAPQTNSVHATLTPNFPAYPSGHATFGAALMQCLRMTLPASKTPMTLEEVLAVDQAISGGGAASPVQGEDFLFISDELDGVARDCDGSVRTEVRKAFGSYAEAVWENSVSRIYLGVHWRFDGIPRQVSNVGGVPLGLAIGIEAMNFFNDAPSLCGPA